MSYDPKQHLIKLQGKDYLPVAARLMWFRQEHPDWGIQTSAVVLDTERGVAIFEAHISTPEGRIVSQAHKSETLKGFGDFVEKAETGSVGRALGMLGYGTQFAPEFDEGSTRIVDTPQEPRPAPAQPQPSVNNHHEDDAPALASIEGLAARKGKSHADIHAAAVKWGVGSSRDLTPGMRRALWDSLQKLPDVPIPAGKKATPKQVANLRAAALARDSTPTVLDEWCVTEYGNPARSLTAEQVADAITRWSDPFEEGSAALPEIPLLDA